jgi:serine/threonine protein kinase
MHIFKSKFRFIICRESFKRFLLLTHSPQLDNFLLAADGTIRLADFGLVLSLCTPKLFDTIFGGLQRVVTFSNSLIPFIV